jgi:hypothetical protein
VLDPADGTDIFQLPPARLELTAGTDAMRCLQLSNKVLRWYADCCQTPIADTAAGPGFPVAGVVPSSMDHEADTRTRDEVLGPPLCRIYERSATAPLPPNAPPPNPKVLGWWMRGLNWLTPFFDGRTKAPRAVPRVLTLEMACVMLARSPSGRVAVAAGSAFLNPFVRPTAT